MNYYFVKVGTGFFYNNLIRKIFKPPSEGTVSYQHDINIKIHSKSK
jgi:hypothetical protein